MSNTVRAMRWQVPAYGSGPEDIDLRTALRHLPVLPAPANVRELLARLGDETIEDESGDLADIILDARYPDIPGGLDSSEKDPRNSKDFFEPISRTANNNVPQPAPYRRSRLPAVIATLTIFGGAALIAWKVKTPPDEAQPPLVILAPPAAEIEYVGIVSFEGSEGSIDIAEDAGDPAAKQTGQGVPTPSANPSGSVVELSEPRDLESAVGTASHAYVTQALVNTFSSRQSDTTDNAAASREEPEGADVPPQALEGLVSAAMEPTISSTGGVQPKPTGPYGTWAASPNACTSKMRRRGYLLTHISPRGARAGDTTCTFDRMKRRGSAFAVAASCSDGKTTWKSNVRLSVNGDRLTWASDKGATAYVRCPSS
jgi:hypothetical protein